MENLYKIKMKKWCKGVPWWLYQERVTQLGKDIGSEKGRKTVEGRTKEVECKVERKKDGQMEMGRSDPLR